MLAHQQPGVHVFFAWVSKAGTPGIVSWLAVAIAAYFFVRRKRRAAASIALAPLLALATYYAAKRIVARARPLTAAGLPQGTDSFPSAHATTSAAICCTLAYVLWRERIVGRPTALALAIVPPLVIGVSRLYLGVHWASDVLSGWTAGVLIAALCVATYSHLKV